MIYLILVEAYIFVVQISLVYPEALIGKKHIQLKQGNNQASLVTLYLAYIMLNNIN